jgi:hypothetical protein
LTAKKNHLCHGIQQPVPAVPALDELPCLGVAGFGGVAFHYFFMRKFWFACLAKALIVFPAGTARSTSCSSS